MQELHDTLHALNERAATYWLEDILLVGGHKIKRGDVVSHSPTHIELLIPGSDRTRWVNTAQIVMLSIVEQ